MVWPGKKLRKKRRREEEGEEGEGRASLFEMAL
jgi:hypothetical protein